MSAPTVVKKPLNLMQRQVLKLALEAKNLALVAAQEKMNDAVAAANAKVTEALIPLRAELGIPEGADLKYEGLHTETAVAFWDVAPAAPIPPKVLRRRQK